MARYFVIIDNLAGSPAKRIGMKGLRRMRIGVLVVLAFVAGVSGGAELKSWTLADGTTFEAKYRAIVSKNVIMESRDGTQKKIPLERFTDADIEFFELDKPPEFKIDFRKKSNQLRYSTRFELTDMPAVVLFTFGVRVEQRSAGTYNHELTVEFFAVASQLGHNNKFILVDRQSQTFIPSKENDFSLEFWSPRVCEMDEYSFNNLDRRGKKYEAFLVLITDKRGEVIASKTANKWLLDNIETLRQRDIGNYMDNTCKRVHPGRPFTVRGGNYE